MTEPEPVYHVASAHQLAIVSERREMNEVRVAHYRIPKTTYWHVPARYYRGSGFESFTTRPRERGGETEAWVDIDGTTFRGRAECSVKDSFCYRTGHQIAMGRLRKQIEPLGYTITKAGVVERMAVQ